MATAKKDPQKPKWIVELRDEFDEAAVILLHLSQSQLENLTEKDARALARRINEKGKQLNDLH